MAILSFTVSAAHLQQPAKGADKGGPWGKAVDGMVCRLTIAPKLTVGQPISAVIEIKNVSDKTRYIIRHLDLETRTFMSLVIKGPNGYLHQTLTSTPRVNEKSFIQIHPGEVKRIEVVDLGLYFTALDAFWGIPLRKPDHVDTGKHELKFTFRSPSYQGNEFRRDPPQLKAGLWAHAIDAIPVTFE
ncbi:MAG TPA: hypothetical protein VE988_18190, partial [Gemmataceae bacterium]|nr:hypothetical protein [Gemmataceae bacterium]